MSFAVSVQPDVEELLKVLRRVGTPRRLHHLELFLDREIREAVRARFDLGVGPGGRDTVDAELSSSVRIHHFLGYDVFRVEVIHKDVFPMSDLRASDTAAGRQSRGQREWVEEHRGPIQSWEDFERYPWPRPEGADLYPLEYVAEHLPEGMGILAQISGVYEPVSWLMGYTTLSLCLYEAPDLVEAMFARVREIILPVARSLAQMERVIGIWMGDDLGFKTGTLVAPRHLRQYVFPIQKEVADITHAQGLPFILHSCGNLGAVMEDLITGVGIQAKHSFEDVIQQVEAFTEQYGDRLAAIGGVDVDLLTSGSEQQVRSRTRQVLEACAPGRGYVLGTGNSVANYIPLGNFLAMLDEGWRFNTGQR
jgi:uroporphyrinogen decarboxylase